MGSHNNITIDKSPAQGKYLNLRVSVCFHFDTRTTLRGTIVRDDTEDPFVTLIRLDDGRYVSATECQYSPEGKE